MSIEALFSNFDRLMQSPASVHRLRRFILDLAVRGTLVPQDPADEPAAALLQRIAKEKARLVKAGEIRRTAALEDVTEDEEIFVIPEGWCWTRLGNIVTYMQRGKSPKYATDTGLSVISQKCVRWNGLDLSVAKEIEAASLEDYEAYRFLRDEDLLWNSTGTGTIGRVVRVVRPPAKLVCDSHVTLVRCPHVVQEYIRTWLRSDHVYGVIEDRAAGSTKQVELTAGLAQNWLVPLPPLPEQHRIVAKVGELMGLCDRLEAAQTERETTRTRLTAASLARLSASEPDEAKFREHAAFTLDNLTPLTTRPEQVKALRRTILNLAVRGKLVPQDPGDEPAAELLQRIAKEKARLVKAGEIRKPKKLPSIDDIPYALPPSWIWTRIREITSDRGQCAPESAFTYIDVTSIDKENGKVAGAKVLQVNEAPSRARKVVRKDDAVYSCVRPYLLNVAVVEKDFNPKPIASTAFAVLNGHGLVLPRYIWIVLRSPFVVARVEEDMRGQAYPAINDADFSILPFPLPPLPEQHRIVAKVGELMGLCDRLEADLTVGSDARGRLLGSLLNEALE